MTRNGFANFISWLALLIALGCIIGLGLAVAIYVEPADQRTQSSGLAFLVVTSWLTLVGGASLIVGGLSSVLATSDAGKGQRWRVRLSVLAGVVALGVGLSFGAAFS